MKGDGAFSVFKWEGGTHRVQRVPATESQGRIHTSTATVAVMPEAEEVEVAIEDKDLKIDVYRSTGPGGQSRQHHRLGGAHHAPADRDRRRRCRTRSRSSRTSRRRCACCGRGCTRPSASGSRPRSRPRDARRSAPASARRRSAPTTSPRTASPTTAIKLTVHRLDQILDGDLEEFTDALQAEERRRALEAAV